MTCPLTKEHEKEKSEMKINSGRKGFIKTILHPASPKISINKKPHQILSNNKKYL